MNKIYKVIWSKVKHQYVVTSEFAHSCTKSTTSRVGKGALAALAAFVLTAGVGGVQAVNTITVDVDGEDKVVTIGDNELQTLLSDKEFDITVTSLEEAGIVAGRVQPLYNGNPSTGAIAIGEGSEVLGNQTTAIGAGSTVTGGYGTAVGNSSTVTGVWGTALGTSSTADGWATAIGGASNAAEAATAVGYHANATASGSVAVGEMSAATGVDSIAHGRGASASGNNAVAIGAGSVANEADTISVGRSDKDSPQYDFQRRITNVGEGINDYDAVNVKQMNRAVDGVVRWDTDGDGNYQEGYLTAKHQLIAGGGNLKVDEEGVHLKTADEYFGDSTEPSSYYLDMTNENGISMGYTNGTSMKVTQNGGVAFSDASGNATWINGNNIDSGANGIFHTGKVIASGSMYVGNDSDEGNAVVTQKQLTSSVDEATEGVVRWDTDGDGNYQEGYLTAKHQLIAGGGNLKVDEEGVHLKTADEYFGDSTEPSSYYLDMTNENGISFGHSDGASVTVGENGTTFTYGDQSTIINGNNITTFGANGVDGQISTGHVYASQDMYIGGNADANKVATMGDLGTEIGEATEGVVRWDTDGDGNYQEGYLTVDELKVGDILNGNGGVLINPQGNITATGTITSSAMNTQELWAGKQGSFHVTPEGNVTMTNNGGEQFFLTKDALMLSSVGDNGNAMITLSNGNLNLLGGGQQVNMTNGGVVFRDIVGNSTTTIQGNTITTGTIHADGMTVGGKDVATVDDVTNATKDAVKYDEKGELHAGKDGTGSLALEKENGSASLISGNGKHSISVGNDGTTINGGLNVNGGLTVDGDTVATSGDVTKVEADVTDIKKQIGVNEDGSYKTIENGANDVITGINKNAAAIGNAALKGTNANGEKYTNLTDAVNGNYDRIEQNTTAIAQNSQAINSLGHRVSDLGDEIDSVGAISAALAGLHPLDYDGTGSKFQISAAMGTYDGTQAAAIGGFYHFNRDVMMSLGGATSFEGDKKTAANIGVTFRVGEGASGKTVSNDILARLEAMDQKIAALEQENKELKNVLGAIDTSLSKEFPDVPANHWAYEAVTKLAGNDVVAGYPDGEFHGDRTMTRYEMAEIIYKAMNRGAKVDQKLVEEFKPEMEQVAANETAQAQSTPAQEAPAQDAQ